MILSSRKTNIPMIPQSKDYNYLELHKTVSRVEVPNETESQYKHYKTVSIGNM